MDSTKQFNSLNEWFLSLPPARQAILREDKWMLAEAAWAANQSPPQASVAATTAGDAVREALNLAWAVVSHADAAGFDASVFEDCSPGFCRDFHDLRHRLNTLPTLTPPETAEAVPVAGGDMNACPICKGHSKFDECSCHYAASKTVHLVPETTRLREDLGQVTRERDDAVKALETAREDERDRLLFEAIELSCKPNATTGWRRGLEAACEYLKAQGAMLPNARTAANQGTK